MAEFASIKNTLTTSDSNGYGTELSEIEETIDHQQFCEPQKVREFFWDMFICDAFIGNFDRHNGNWGFIFQRESRETAFAPIYDCGSSLYPQLQIRDYRSVLDNPDEIKNRILVFPTSAIKINGSKINYCGFISSHENENCDKALKRIVPRICMDKIGSMISDMEELSDIQKEFYITMLTKRKELILDPNFEQL